MFFLNQIANFEKILAFDTALMGIIEYISRNLRSWCVKNKDHSQLIFMDDKAKILIGEPGTPEAATSHNRTALMKSGIILEASGHNYHSVNITPSVILNCEIPNSPQELFYSGKIYVSLKDSAFHGSDPL